jgi:hypothetical protein
MLNYLAGGPFKPAVGLSGAFDFAVVFAFLADQSPGRKVTLPLARF